jgi:hypothetical protein
MIKITEHAIRRDNKWYLDQFKPGYKIYYVFDEKGKYLYRTNSKFEELM